MSFPAFYNPDRVGTLYTPDTAAAIAAGLAARTALAADDRYRTLLILVDTQVDFIHPDGALAVPGAVDDTRRTIEWLFRNLAHITTIAVSLDSHTPLQIFYPTWWTDPDGRAPAPFTAITAADVQAGRWRPVIEPEWSIQYVERLERDARKTLMIWPYHTMIGTPGQAITPTLYEAIAYHAAARSAQPHFLSKGFLARTEHYSIVEPEVKIPEERERGGELNASFLEMLASYDRVYIAGQAKSHCVLETVSSLVRYFANRPEVLQRLHVLIDCTSSVIHPQIDFEQLATATLTGYQAAGLHLVRSTDPVV